MKGESTASKYLPTPRDLITAGTILVALAMAWASLKSDTALLNQKVDQYAAAQEKYNAELTAQAKDLRKDSDEQGKDIVAIKKDVEFLRDKKFSFAPSKGEVAYVPTSAKIEKETSKTSSKTSQNQPSDKNPSEEEGNDGAIVTIAKNIKSTVSDLLNP